MIRIPTSKMPKNFVDVHQDLGYASSWPSRPVRPIFKVKRAPKHAYPHLDDFRVLLQTIFWVIRIPTSKIPNVFVDVRQDLVYAYDWPSRLVRLIWRVKRAPK